MHIVLIEQDSHTLSMLNRQLIKWGHGVSPARDPDQAVDFLDTEPRADMIIYDRTSSIRDDSVLFKVIHEMRKTHYVYLLIMHSQGIDIDREHHSAAALIDDVVAMPLDYGELQAHITLGARIAAMENELNQKYLVIKRNYYQTIQVLDQLINNYDESLGRHCKRVGTLALELAKRHPDITATDYPLIEAAAILHDIGFIGLPRNLFGKCRTSMTGDDLQLFQSHPERGEEILSQIDFLKPVGHIVRHHHEQYNGRGFPDNLADEKISLPAQIIAAASYYDFLLNFKKIAMASIAESLQHFRGYQLSPQLVDMLLEVHLAHLQQESNQKDKSVFIQDLKEGMILSRDIIMRSGAFIMPEGHRLDQRTIEKLVHYEKLGNINDAVFINK